MIVERPVVELLTFQVWDSELGSWRDLQTHATSVDIRRGGQQSGASTTTQVGTLDATLLGAIDLSQETALKPNSPIRVIRPQLAPAVVWDLLPANIDWPAVGISPRALWTTLPDGSSYLSGYGGTMYSSFGGYSVFEVRWGAGGDASRTYNPFQLPFAAPGSWLGSPTSNQKPVGAFAGGERYVIRTTIADLGTGSPPVKLVVYRGTVDAPIVYAESALRNPSTTDTPLELEFAAPYDDDWNVGILMADGAVATNDTGFGWRVSGFRIWDTGRTRPEFTGTIADLAQSVQYDKGNNTKRTFTSIQAVDAVQPLANTDRYGSIANNGLGYQTWADRIQQLSTSARGVQIEAPTENNVVIYDQNDPAAAHNWAGAGAVTGGGTWYCGQWAYGEYRIYRLSGSGAGTVNGVREHRRTYDFIPGAGYAASITVQVDTSTGVTAAGTWAIAYSDGTNIVYGDPIDMSSLAPQQVTVRFQPTSAYGFVGIYQRTAMTLATTGTPRLTFRATNTLIAQVGDPRGYVLQDVGYESTLLSHFDLACNSVGARWYVTKRGIVIFRRQLEDAEPALTFTDDATGDVSYTDVALSFDTRNVVNSIKLNQHGYDPSTGNTDDYSTTFTSESSIGRWGSRAAELDTCLYTGAPHQQDLEERAREVTSSLNRPTYAVTSFTFNVQSNPELLDELELRNAITVRYEGRSQTCRVLSLSHKITPTRWLVTVEVNEIVAGITFAQLAEGFTGTYAQFNALHAGRTYRQVDADPLRSTP